MGGASLVITLKPASSGKVVPYRWLPRPTSSACEVQEGLACALFVDGARLTGTVGDCSKGHCVAIIVGGARESLAARPGVYDIVLEHRKVRFLRGRGLWLSSSVCMVYKPIPGQTHSWIYWD